MEHSSYRKTNRSSASQEILAFMDPESSLPHSQTPFTSSYPEQDRSSPWSTCIQLFKNPLYYYLPIYAQMFPVVSFSRVTLQNPVRTFSLLHTCNIPRPYHSSWLDYPNNIWWEVQIIKPLVKWPSPLPCYLVSFKSKYPPLHPVLKHPQPTFLLQCDRPSFTPYKQPAKLLFSMS